MSDVPAPPERPTPSSPHPRPGGCLLVGLAVGALMVVTVLVVVSLNLAGLIGGDGSRAEQDERLQEIEDETGIATSSRDLDDPPQRDLELGACDRLVDGTVGVTGSVTNNTDSDVSYEITVAVHERAGAELGPEVHRTMVALADVAPDGTVPWTATLQARPGDAFTCKVLTIERQPM